MKSKKFIAGSIMSFIVLYLFYADFYAMVSLFTPFIGYVIGIYVLTPAFLYFHRKTIGRKMRYGFQENHNKIKYTKKSRIIFPILLTINLAFFCAENNTIREFIQTMIYLPRDPTLAILIYVSPFLFVLSFGIFSAIWCLEDSGISYSNVELVEENEKNLQARSVGDWFDFLLKGYSGIGVIISYISLIYKTPELLFTLVCYPFLLMIYTLPVVIIFNSSKKKRNELIFKIALKQNITERITISVEYAGINIYNE